MACQDSQMVLSKVKHSEVDGKKSMQYTHEAHTQTSGGFQVVCQEVHQMAHSGTTHRDGHLISSHAFVDKLWQRINKSDTQSTLFCRWFAKTVI